MAREEEERESEGGESEGGESEVEESEGGESAGGASEVQESEGGESEGGESEGGKSEGGESEGGESERGESEVEESEGDEFQVTLYMTCDQPSDTHPPPLGERWNLNLSPTGRLLTRPRPPRRPVLRAGAQLGGMTSPPCHQLGGKTSRKTSPLCQKRPDASARTIA